MALPNALLLPSALLPLYIFEERYRLMLRHTLQTNRLFCVALMKPGISDAQSADDLFQIAGLGLVRACVNNDDGTSHLILQGLARVEMIDFVQEEPFRIARIREVRSEVPNLIEAEALSAKVVELCKRLREQGHEISAKLERNLQFLTNPEVLADVVTNVFVADVLERQYILEQPLVSERLRMLIRYLHEREKK